MSLEELRQRLHSQPELSAQERETAAVIAGELESCQPASLLLGLGVMETGLCAVFEGERAGPCVLLRCELDALPIHERNDFGHRSTRDGVGHHCGHDGHMATLVGVARDLQIRPIARGRVCLLFQPAEESGEGAAAVLADPQFRALGPPDFVYAFHNVPKFDRGRVLVRDGTFAQGSVGFRVEFIGRTAHSSYPEYGVSPAPAVTALVTAVNRLDRDMAQELGAPVLGTVSFARLGAPGAGTNFGIAPGEGVVMGVLRAQKNGDLDRLRTELRRLADALAQEHGLAHSLEWHEEFAATVSDPDCNDVVRAAAAAVGLEVSELNEPFRWSEDFGRFTEHYRGALFGLGSGIAQPQLHEAVYDYPDDLIAPGVKLYRAIIDQHLA